MDKQAIARLVNTVAAIAVAQEDEERQLDVEKVVSELFYVAEDAGLTYEDMLLNVRDEKPLHPWLKEDKDDGSDDLEPDDPESDRGFAFRRS